MNTHIKTFLSGACAVVMAFGAVTICSGLAKADTKIPIDEAHFPDKAFRECLKRDYIDVNGDGALSSAEIKDITDFRCGDCGVKDLTGIEYLTELECLFCMENDLTEVDVSKNLKLNELRCEKNKLTKLDVSKNTKLEILTCWQNPIESLDVSYNPELVTLACGDTKITSLDISKNTKLSTLWAENLGLTELDVSNSKEYWSLNVSGNKLKSLDVSGYTYLESLYCDNNELETLNLSGCTKLSKLICNDNKLNALDVSSCSQLYELRCQGNNIASLDLAGCESLKLAYACKEKENAEYTIYIYTNDNDIMIYVDKDTVITVDPLELDDMTETLDLKCGYVGSPKIKGSEAAAQVKSSDESVVKVIKGNTVYAVKAGSTTITVTCDGKDHDILVRVLYKDVEDTHKFWFEPTYALTEKGVVKGYDKQTRFKPGNKCTRAQMVTFIWRLAGSPDPETKDCKFSDVKEKDYFYKACIWGNEKGIVEGYKDGTFQPKVVCARRHAVTFLWRLAGKPEPTVDKTKFTDVFKDISEDDYFYKACLWASEKKIVAGYDDNTFRPDGDCLRRQMVTFLYKYDKFVGVK